MRPHFALLLVFAACFPPVPPAAPGPSCTGGRTACGDVCAPLETDDQHCGACGSSCAAAERCVKSACRPRDCGATDCGEQQVCIAGACTDASCVALSCPAGQLCARGTCSPTECAGVVCTSGLVCLGGMCRDTACDGVICPAPQVCQVGRCVPGPSGTCMDGVKSGLETDVDCGGPSCAPCARGLSCAAERDCASMRCFANRCSDCGDGLKDSAETDVDCGGVCAPGRRCADGSTCVAATDCQSGTCSGAGTCISTSCSDGVKNGAEADRDCGAACPEQCGPMATCAVGADCRSGVCTAGRCVGDGTCADGVKNRDESDVDCGGTRCLPCANERTCTRQSDCGTLFCSSGLCSDGFNLPDAGMRVASYLLPWGAQWIAVGHLDGDQNLDLATVHKGNGFGTGSTSIFTGTPTGTFSPPLTIQQGSYWGYDARVAIAEVNGDGAPDLVLGGVRDYTTNQNGWMQGNGNGTFQTVVPFRSTPTNYRHFGWAVADLTGDGQVDVATGTHDGTVSWARGTGNGFTMPQPQNDGGLGLLEVDLPSVDCPYTAAGRIDGNAAQDLAVCCRNGLRIVLGGSMPQVLPARYLAGRDPTFALIVDLDKDGKSELVALSQYSYELYILKGNGDGTFQAPLTRYIGSNNYVHAADFNNDTHVDLLTGGATVRMWMGQSDGGFAVTNEPWGLASWRLGYPGIGDFDRDGKLDLAFDTTNFAGIYVFLQR